MQRQITPQQVGNRKRLNTDFRGINGMNALWHSKSTV